MRKRSNWLMAAGVTFGVALILFYTLRPQPLGRAQRLPDGSWLNIRDALVAEELSRAFPDGNLLQRTLARIVPDRWSAALPRPVRSCLFPHGGASLHLSGEGKACLFILTGRVNLPAAGGCNLQQIVVDDGHEHGMNSSSCQVTVEAGHQRIQGWAWEDTSKGSRTLRVRCYAAGQDARPVEVAQFTMPNPAYSWPSR